MFKNNDFDLRATFDKHKAKFLFLPILKVQLQQFVRSFLEVQRATEKRKKRVG
jgi:hypothetical protein